MNILFLHERFIFRYGADRVLIMLAQYLVEQGHKVSFICNTYDFDTLAPIAERIIRIPVPNVSPEGVDQATTALMESHLRHLIRERPIDVVVNGGWPFVTSIPGCVDLGVPVVFIDFGVVPLDGYNGVIVDILRRHKANRRSCLPLANAVIAISNFIFRTQSEPEAGTDVRCIPILLGADHFDGLAGTGEEAGPRSPALSALEHLVANDVRLILNLGRWEPGCYKGSDRSLEVFRQVSEKYLKVRLLVLAEKPAIEVPPGLDGLIVPIGFPSDRQLARIIKLADFGICMSRWEGFNLPLAESQWQGCQALVLNVGAHPEVVADPWYLCDTEDEMGEKAVELLQSRHTPECFEAAVERFRRDFTWAACLSKMTAVILEATRRRRRRPSIARKSLSVRRGMNEASP